jgi:hypothetical protein
VALLGIFVFTVLMGYGLLGLVRKVIGPKKSGTIDTAGTYFGIAIIFVDGGRESVVCRVSPIIEFDRGTLFLEWTHLGKVTVSRVFSPADGPRDRRFTTSDTDVTPIRFECTPVAHMYLFHPESFPTQDRE